MVVRINTSHIRSFIHSTHLSLAFGFAAVRRLDRCAIMSQHFVPSREAPGNDAVQQYCVYVIRTPHRYKSIYSDRLIIMWWQIHEVGLSSVTSVQYLSSILENIPVFNNVVYTEIDTSGHVFLYMDTF